MINDIIELQTIFSWSCVRHRHPMENSMFPLWNSIASSSSYYRWVGERQTDRNRFVTLTDDERYHVHWTRNSTNRSNAFRFRPFWVNHYRNSNRQNAGSDTWNDKLSSSIGLSIENIKFEKLNWRGKSFDLFHRENQSKRSIPLFSQL